MPVISPVNVLPVLLGEMRVSDGVVICEEMIIARVRDGQVVGIACDHPSHGAHPRYREAYAKLSALASKHLPPMPKNKCDVCNGTTWLVPSSQGAARMVLMAITCHLFRGIQVTPPKGFDLTKNRDTLLRFLREQVKE